MNWNLMVGMAALPLLVACGASMDPPTQRLAAAQAAERSAAELGAKRVPMARLSLKLATTQIAQAQKAMADDENVKADALLIRAKADAELAIAQTREQAAHVQLQKATDAWATQRSTNEGQGAVK